MVPLPEAAATHQILMKTSELLNPYYVTGFTEADGCFYVSIYREPKAKIGFRIVPVFYITQDLASEQVLYAIHHTIAPSEPGKFTKRLKDNTLTYSLRGVKACKSVIAHFDKYPLLGEKQNNFMIFRSILGLLEQKKHLTDPAEVAKLAYTMNTKGASRRRSFPELLRHQSFTLPQGSADIGASIPARSELPNPCYVTGLIDGDGTFYLSFRKTGKLKATFAIGTLNASRHVLDLLVRYFNCGKIYKVTEKYSRFQVESVKDLIEKIIPHFTKFPLHTKKKEDFDIFREVVELLWKNQETKSSLTRENLLFCVEKAYEMNCNGKRRHQTKEEFIARVLQDEKKV
jgi:hypothetical protein